MPAETSPLDSSLDSVPDTQIDARLFAMPLTVLVTGANGLVGRALCGELAARGFKVLAAVRRPAAFEPMAGVAAIDAPDLSDANAQWQLTGVDVVVHTAARVHVMNPAPDEAQRFLSVNRDGSVRLARQCAVHHVKRLIFLSTIKVNGECTLPGAPFTANDLPKPADPYAVSKREAETGLQAVAEQTGLEVTIIRPPLVYGPGAKGNLGVLERAVRRGLPLPIGALNVNRRSLVSLANLVDLTVSCVTHRAAANHTFLVSDDQDVSTLGLAELIAQACGVRLRTISVQSGLLKVMASLLGRREMMQRLTDSLQVDVSPTRHQLNWQPAQTMAQAMAEAFTQDS